MSTTPTPYVTCIRLLKSGQPKRMTVRCGRETFRFVWREVAGGDMARFTDRSAGRHLGIAAVEADRVARALLDLPDAD